MCRPRSLACIVEYHAQANRLCPPWKSSDYHQEQLLGILVQELEKTKEATIPEEDLPSVKARLIAQCEQVKKELSGKEQADIFVLDLLDGVDFDLTISREKFVKLNQVRLRIITGQK